MRSNTAIGGFIWKTLEQYSVMAVQFVLQIILARILDPRAYGVLAMVTVFTSLANVMVQYGFSTALVQKKDIDEGDISSAFYTSMVLAIVFYLLIFVFAPWIADFYGMPELSLILRVMGITLFTGAYTSIQNAIIRRNMQFRVNFVSSLISIVISGVGGIIAAYHRFGVWALVLQQLTYGVLVLITLNMGIRWFPKAIFSLEKVKSMFSFGWKIMVNGLIDELFTQIRSLVIGRKYSSEDLAFFSRGRQFPDLLVKSINSSIQSVLLPVLSKKQDDMEKLVYTTRNTIRLNSYVIFPILIGFACISPSLIRILLTEKWMPCVPYAQIFCIYFSKYPISITNFQALYAIGRSDLVLRAQLISRGVDFLLLFVTIPFGPIYIAWGMIIAGSVELMISSHYSASIMKISILNQIKDVLPQAIVTLVMGIMLVFVTYILPQNDFVILFSQIIIGILTYILVSTLFRLPEPKQIRSIAINIVRGRK